MNYHQIEVDLEVLNYLKSQAEPFVDTPNTVLRRLLLGKKHHSRPTESLPGFIPDFPSSIPKGLEQILQVIYLVRAGHQTRNEATRLVAQKHEVAIPTVIDKYCRQLGKTASEIDGLLEEQTLNGIEMLLGRQFAQHKDMIRSFFVELRGIAA